MEVKQRLVIFDFDDTLTTRDTLLEFIRFACGKWAFVWGFLLHSPLLVLMKMHLYHNGKAKERLFSYYFKGWTEERFNQTCQAFADSHRYLLRSQMVDVLRKAQQEYINNVTDIKGVSANSQVERKGEIYDLMGRRLSRIPERGVYIIDGKVYVK